MGQATQRKKLYLQALGHLKQFGLDQARPDPDKGTSARWLHQHFVKTLPAASEEGAASWQNRVYLDAQRHLDPAVRRGIRALMNDVLTCGLEAGRVVFALLADAELPEPALVGEFDTCEQLAAWVAFQLKMPRHNVRVRYSQMFVPARAGLFGLMPTLELITTTKPVGTLPDVVTTKSEREAQRRPRLTFLVSVFTNQYVDLSALTPGAPAPTFELAYWGPKDSTPERRAQVTPLYALQAFDALQMLGFWEPLARAEAHLAPARQQAMAAAGDALPTILVSEHGSCDPRYVNGTELWVRWRDLDLPAAPVYHGSFGADFLWQFERLGAQVVLAPGIAPPLAPPQDPAASESDWAGFA